LFIDLLSSRVNDRLKLSEHYRIGRLFWPIVSTIGLSDFHIIVLTLERMLTICLAVLTEYVNVTDTQMDRQTKLLWQYLCK